MPVKGYYDGSKRSGSRQLAVLAGLAGVETVWADFECAWKLTLEKHQAPLHEDGIRRFHMADAMSLEGRFSEDEGWDCDRVRELVVALFNAMAEFKTKPLMALSCCVDLGAHKTLKEARTLKSPEAICCNFCVGGIRIPDEDEGKPKSVVLYFDNNEKFLRKIDRAWRSVPESKCRGWARQVSAIVQTNSSSYPIQASDMIAWLAGSHYLNRSVKCSNEGWIDSFWQSIPIALDHYHRFYDREKLIEGFIEA